MTNTQLYLAIGVPILSNGFMLTLLLVHINSRFEAQEKLFTEKLLRVEQVLDARLRLMEEKFGIRP